MAGALGGLAEVDDLDLDLEGAVTVVEWGEGLAEGLSADRLEITIGFAAAGQATDPPGDEPRVVRIRPVGPRWRRPEGSTARLPGQPPASANRVR